MPLRLKFRFGYSALLLGTLVAECTMVQEHETSFRNEQLLAQAKAARLECDQKFPAGNPKTAVARAQCQKEAAEIARPTNIFPDLMDAFWETRMRVAEEVQSGKLTIAQGNEIITNRNTELTSEGQRRIAADRAVSAQENANRAALFAAYMANNTPPIAMQPVQQNRAVNCNSYVNGNMVSTNCN
jgi:hypothetical protein